MILCYDLSMCAFDHLSNLRVRSVIKLCVHSVIKLCVHLVIKLCVHSVICPQVCFQLLICLVCI